VAFADGGRQAGRRWRWRSGFPRTASAPGVETASSPIPGTWTPVSGCSPR